MHKLFDGNRNRFLDKVITLGMKKLARYVYKRLGGRVGWLSLTNYCANTVSVGRCNEVVILARDKCSYLSFIGNENRSTWYIQTECQGFGADKYSALSTLASMIVNMLYMCPTLCYHMYLIIQNLHPIISTQRRTLISICVTSKTEILNLYYLLNMDIK